MDYYYYIARFVGIGAGNRNRWEFGMASARDCGRGTGSATGQRTPSLKHLLIYIIYADDRSTAGYLFNLLLGPGALKKTLVK